MQKDSKFFDDMAKMASGAAGELLEMKREFDAMTMVKVEQFLQKMNLATREEVDALHAMLANIRKEQEDFKQRLEKLESRLK